MEYTNDLLEFGEFQKLFIEYTFNNLKAEMEFKRDNFH